LFATLISLFVADPTVAPTYKFPIFFFDFLFHVRSMDVIPDHYPCFISAPMKWFKMKVLGRGSYGTVHLVMATTNSTTSSSSGFMAVKSAVIDKSFSLMKEVEILQEFVDCPAVVCVGV
jgi:hypothetical protein